MSKKKFAEIEESLIDLRNNTNALWKSAGAAVRLSDNVKMLLMKTDIIESRTFKHDGEKTYYPTLERGEVVVREKKLDGWHSVETTTVRIPILIEMLDELKSETETEIKLINSKLDLILDNLKLRHKSVNEQREEACRGITKDRLVKVKKKEGD